MSCLHAGDQRGERILCRHFGEWLAPSRCECCQAFVAGQSAPEVFVDLPTEDQPSSLSSPCTHRGEILADEPCSCGSETRISIHACHSPDRVRSFQNNAWCVPLQLDWNRLADPMARTSFQCCESCEHHTLSPNPETV